MEVFKKPLFFVPVILIIILPLAFAVLTYFNIIPLPKFLSPSQIPVRGKAFNPEEPILLPTPSPTNTITIAANITADMKNFTDELIPANLIPINLVVTQQDVKNTNQYIFYGGSWQREDGVIFMPTIEYNQQKNIIDKQLVIYLPDTTSNLNSASSLSLTKTYTKIIPPLLFRCTLFPQKDIKSKFCESFWQDDNKIKKGINVTSPILGLKGTQLFYCEHYPDTPAYSWKSCSIYFKD